VRTTQITRQTMVTEQPKVHVTQIIKQTMVKFTPIFD
jgi:hypothetical protein